MINIDGNNGNSLVESFGATEQDRKLDFFRNLKLCPACPGEVFYWDISILRKDTSNENASDVEL